jgi:hypothetical protein
MDIVALTMAMNAGRITPMDAAQTPAAAL